MGTALAGFLRLTAHPFVLAAVLCVVALLWQGQDASFDLLNYHLYTPLAWLGGRLFPGPGSPLLDGVAVPLDVAVAQLQTWHNPMLDLPLAWLVREGASGVLVAAWLSLPVVVAVGFALRTMDLLWPAGRGAGRTWFAALAGMTGGAVLPVVGTSFNDAFAGALVMAALWWMVDSQGRRGNWATWWPIGLLAGAAAGFKLTSAIHCLGFVAAAMVTAMVGSQPGGGQVGTALGAVGRARNLVLHLLALGVGGVSGFLVAWGPWGWRLWREHGNPVFPYFNQWFLSPDAAALPHTDQRFQLANGWDWGLVPFQLLVPSMRFSEMPVADPRLVLGFAAVGLGLGLAWVGRRYGGALGPAFAGGVPDPRRLVPVAAFLLAAFVAWACVYGIYRYLFTLELLCAVLLAATVHAWVAPRWRWLCLPLLLVVLVKVADPPRWGRQPFRTPMVEVQWPTLPADTMLLVSSNAPVAHAVAWLPERWPVLSVRNNFMIPAHCTGLQRQVEVRIDAHAGSLWLLRPQEDPHAEWQQVQAYGLEVAGACLAVQDSLMGLEVCPLVRQVAGEGPCAGVGRVP